MWYKDIPNFSVVGHFVKGSRTFCGIFGEGIMRNISVK